MFFLSCFFQHKNHRGTHRAYHPLNWMTPLCLQRNFCWHLCCFSIHLISYTVSRFRFSTSQDFFTTSDSSSFGWCLNDITMWNKKIHHTSSEYEIQIHCWLQNGTCQCQRWLILWYLLGPYFLSHRHRYILIVVSIPPPYEPPVRWTFLESKPLSRKCLKQMNAKGSWKWAGPQEVHQKMWTKLQKKIRLLRLWFVWHSFCFSKSGACSDVLKSSYRRLIRK